MSRFTKGQRVKPTAAMPTRRWRSGRVPMTGPIYGTVVGQGRSEHLVTVLVDGHRSASVYHEDFWEEKDGGTS